MLSVVKDGYLKVVGLNFLLETLPVGMYGMYGMYGMWGMWGMWSCARMQDLYQYVPTII